MWGKTFAQMNYNKLGKDIVKLQKLLGHKNLDNTAKYISFERKDLDEAVDSMNLLN